MGLYAAATATVERARPRGRALAAADHARRWRQRRGQRAGCAQAPQRKPDRSSGWRRRVDALAGGDVLRHNGAGAQCPVSVRRAPEAGACEGGGRRRDVRRFRLDRKQSVPMDDRTTGAGTRPGGRDRGASVSLRAEREAACARAGPVERAPGLGEAPSAIGAQKKEHGAVAGEAGQRNRQVPPASEPPRKRQRTSVPCTFAGLACGLVRRISQCAGAFASYLRSAELFAQSGQRDVLDPKPQKRGKAALFPLPLPSAKGVGGAAELRLPPNGRGLARAR